MYERGDVQQMGMQIDEWSLDQAMRVMDVDRSGSVTYNEFQPWWIENADRKALQKRAEAGTIDLSTCTGVTQSFGETGTGNLAPWYPRRSYVSRAHPRSVVVVRSDGDHDPDLHKGRQGVPATTAG
jgi:hypothetical protein